MMKSPQHHQRQRHSTGSSIAPTVLVSFLGDLLEHAMVSYTPSIGDSSSPSTKSGRPSFVLVTDNARVHTKFRYSCNCQLDSAMTDNLPRATSCPSDLNAMHCCMPGRCGMYGNGMPSSLTKMLRVASTGSLSSRWDATNNICFSDDGSIKPLLKSDAAARPPSRSWNLDNSDDHSDHEHSPEFQLEDDDDKDDFGAFVLLGDEYEEEDEEEDPMPSYLGMRSLDPASVDLKSVSMASSPSFVAIRTAM